MVWESKVPVNYFFVFGDGFLGKRKGDQTGMTALSGIERAGGPVEAVELMLGGAQPSTARGECMVIAGLIVMNRLSWWSAYHRHVRTFALNPHLLHSDEAMLWLVMHILAKPGCGGLGGGFGGFGDFFVRQ